jgi:hypothetical protein
MSDVWALAAMLQAPGRWPTACTPAMRTAVEGQMPVIPKPGPAVMRVHTDDWNSRRIQFVLEVLRTQVFGMTGAHA